MGLLGCRRVLTPSTLEKITPKGGLGPTAVPAEGIRRMLRAGPSAAVMAAPEGTKRLKAIKGMCMMWVVEGPHGKGAQMTEAEPLNRARGLLSGMAAPPGRTGRSCRKLLARPCRTKVLRMVSSVVMN